MPLIWIKRVWLTAAFLAVLTGSVRAQTVQVVSSLDAELLEFIASEMEKEGLAVEFLRMADDTGIPDYVRDPATQPDILFGVSTIVLARLADQGLLEKREPAWGRDLPVGLADEEGRWFAVFGDPMTIVYNHDYFFQFQDVPESMLPEGWEDLRLKRMKGSLIVETPTPFNKAGYLLACLIDHAKQEDGDWEEGFALLSDIDANLLRTYETSDALLSEHGLFSGKAGSISFATLSEYTRCCIAELPIGLVVPREGMFLYPRGAGLVKGAGSSAFKVYDALMGAGLLSVCARVKNCYPLIFEDAYRFSGLLGQEHQLPIYPTDHDSVLGRIDEWIGRWQNLIYGSQRHKEERLDDAVNTVMIFFIPVVLVILIYTSRKRK